MSDFFQSIKKLNADLISFINRYDALEESDSFSSNFIKKFKNLSNSFNSSSNQYSSLLTKHQSDFNDFFYQVISKNNTERENLENKLLESLDEINKKYTQKVNNLNDEIAKLKELSNKKIKNLEDEIVIYKASSQQKAKIFDIECDENKTKYDYQRSSAIDHYNQNMSEFNNRLQAENEKLDSSHKELLVDFDDNNKELIEKINVKIDKCYDELNEVNDKLDNVRNQMKERFLQESISLNDEIRVLLTEKNTIIDDARKKYFQSQLDASQEKDGKRQEYQQESQKILKDFVYNMTELDESINKYKNNYNKQVDEEKRSYFYNQLSINKNQNNDIKKILDNGLQVNGEYDKYTKRLMKNKKYTYYKQQTSQKDLYTKQLNNIDLALQREIENTRSNKELLDLDKNYSLKILAEKESRDNKYYQELNNIYENEMNLLIKISNMKYNKKANLVKCQSRIRNKGLEKDLDISEANFQKKIEMIQTEIKGCKLEIDGALKLKEIIHSYEDSTYKKDLKHLSVSTLLEIEKCKILDSFNKRQYEYNIESSELNKNYGLKRLDIDTEKLEALNNLNIQLVNNALNRDIVMAAYKIKEDQIYEAGDKHLQERNKQYSLDYINHTVLKERFKGEIKIIQQIMSTYILLLRDTESFCYKILLMFFSNVDIRPEYHNLIKIFIHDFLFIIKNFYSELISTFSEMECEIILKRIDFEEKFKFKSYYNDLLQIYEADRKKLLSKRNSISDTIDNYVKTIETFNSRIYTLENQNLIIKQRKAQASQNERLSIAKEIQKNKDEILNHTKKIEDINRLKRILDKDNLALSKKLKNLDRDYNMRVKEIEKMQYNSATSFYELRRNITNYTAATLSRIQIQFTNKLDNPQLYQSYDTILDEFKTKLTLMDDAIIEQLYSIINKFSNDTVKSIKKDKQLLILKFTNDTNKIYSDILNDIEDNQKEFDKKITSYLNENKELENKIKLEQKHYTQLFNTVDEQYNNQIQNILLKKKESMNTFYKEFYAMCDNLSDINSNYTIETNQANENFKNDKSRLVKEIDNEKNELSINLENFIKGKEELINHLPSATKFQSQQMQRETREINQSIELDIRNETYDSAVKKRALHKNILNIDLSLDQVISENTIIHQKNVLKEKKKHLLQMRHLEKQYK